MLKKLLSSLQHLQVQKNQSNQNLPSQASQPTQQNQLPENQSPNLLDTSLSPDTNILETVTNAPTKVSLFLFKAILAVQAAFIIVFLVNMFFDWRLANLASQLKDSSSKIVTYNTLVTNTNRLLAKIARYKVLSPERVLVNANTDFIIKKTNEVATLDAIGVTDKIVNVQANAESPISFSLLINNYFTNDKVASVVLNSANLDATKKVFRVNIDVTFK